MPASIRLLVLDVDGVLTDGRLYFGPRGEALKAFHVRDGVGIKQLRRALDKQIDLHATVMRAVMTTQPKSIGPRELAAEAAHLMEVHRITALPVADAHGRLIGALNVHDLMRAGVV